MRLPLFHVSLPKIWWTLPESNRLSRLRGACFDPIPVLTQAVSHPRPLVCSTTDEILTQLGFPQNLVNPLSMLQTPPAGERCLAGLAAAHAQHNTAAWALPSVIIVAVFNISSQKKISCHSRLAVAQLAWSPKRTTPPLAALATVAARIVSRGTLGAIHVAGAIALAQLCVWKGRPAIYHLSRQVAQTHVQANPLIKRMNIPRAMLCEHMITHNVP